MQSTFVEQFKNAVVEHPLLFLLLAEFLILTNFYWPVFTGQNSFFYSDITFFLEPESKFLAHSLAQFKIPLWNIYNHCGMPQIPVTFPSLFYPIDWFLVLLPFSCGLALAMMAHQLVTAAGSFLLLRSFNWNVSSALLASITASLSGYMFSLPANHGLSGGVAWFVMSLHALRALETCAESKLFVRLVCSVLSIALLIFSGRPEVIVPSFAGLVIYVLVSRLKRRSETFVDLAQMYQIRALFLGATITLPELLPVGEWLAVSRRATGLLAPEVFLYSAHWYEIISIFVGQCLGDLRLHGAIYRPLVCFAGLPPYLSCAYLGPFVAIAAIWGACDRTWTLRWFFIAVAIMGSVLCMGTYTPVLPALVSLVPSLGFVRLPVKLFFVVTLAIAVLAGRGLQVRTTIHSVYASGLISLLALTSSLGLFAFSASHRLMVSFLSNDRPISLSLDAQSRLAEAFFCFALCGIVASTFAAGKALWQRKLMPVAIILCSAVTLLLNAYKNERLFGSSDHWQKPSFVASEIVKLDAAAISGDKPRVLNLCIERLTVPAAYLPSDPLAASDAEFQYDREIIKPNSNLDFFISEACGFEGAMVGDFFHTFLHCYFASSQTVHAQEGPWSDLPLARFCGLTATSYVVTQSYRKIGNFIPVPFLDKAYFKLELDSRDMNVRIYKVLKTLPHAYFTQKWRNIASHNTVLDSIVSPAENDLIPGAGTCVETNDSESTSNEELRDDQRLIPVVNEPELVKFSVQTERDGMLVLADQNYAGWRSFVDGQEVSIFKANGFMRAVQVAKGEHLVEFRYDPDSLKLGCALALLAAGLLGYFGYVSRRK